MTTGTMMRGDRTVRAQRDRELIGDADRAEHARSLLDALDAADAILVGGASGMSAASGFRHYYTRDDRFVEWFGDLEARHGYHSSFAGLYHRYADSAQRWAFLARMICCCIDSDTGRTYTDLAELLAGRNVHVLTTNQDAQFERVFPTEQISAIQGDWRLLQCSRRCRDYTVDGLELAREICSRLDESLECPAELIPHCRFCGAEMEPWVRSFVFLEGSRYREEYAKVNSFIEANMDSKMLFLELGVGRMTPMFIQEPFWNLTYGLPESRYVTINPKDALVPVEIADRALAIDDDIAAVLADARVLAEDATNGGDRA